MSLDSGLRRNDKTNSLIKCKSRHNLITLP
jgi:hypothetical protein